MRAPLASFTQLLSSRSSRHIAILAAIFLSATVAFAQGDVTPPSLQSLSFGAASVNVSSAPQQVTVNATATDDLSGVSYVYIGFSSPSSGQFFGMYLSRISGTSLNGSYSGSVTFPLFSQGGTYTAYMYLYDNAGNQVYLSSSTLANLGFPSTLGVIDTNPDTTPPVLLGATFSPSSFDTSNGPQTTTINLHISDSQTGVTFSNLSYYPVILSPAGSGSSGPFYYIAPSQFSLVSGTAQNGFWAATIAIPQYANANLTFNQISLRDGIGNNLYLTSNQLVAAGINPVLAVTSSPADFTPPTLRGFSVSPSIVNTSASFQNLQLTISASDDLSGVDFSPSTPNFANIQFYFTSPSGNQSAYISPFTAPTLVAGNSLSGTYQFKFGLPQYSEEGTWKVALATLKDKTGNLKSYTPTQIQALGFSTTFIVSKPSLVPDGTVGPSGGTVTDTTFGSRASVTFPAGIVSQTTTVAIDVFANALAVPTPRGFTMPGTYFENIAFSPELPEPLPSPGVTVVLPLITPMTPGAHLSLYHIDTVVGLSPAMNASGNPVVGTVNSDGVSATFTNVVTFSTLVAYISNGSILGDVSGDGIVNCTDVSILKSSFGKSTGQPGFNSAADLNNDGTVNILDQFIISRQLPSGMACK